MAEVTRFPHYHQAENVVTNHVMVMLRMLYDAAPPLLEGLLQALCTDEVSVGPRFSQQIAESHSVPDGLILQEPLAIFVETKLGASFNNDQLKRHCQSIVDRLPGRTNNFLIALGTGLSGFQIPTEVATIAHEHNIKVVASSFSDLLSALTVLPKTDHNMDDAIQEFADFIYAQNLVPREDQFIVAMLTGTSWRENLAYGVYYEPAERNPKWQRAAFLGLYHDRQISHVGRIITAVVAVEDENGEIIFEAPEKGNLNDQQRQQIRDVIKAAQSYYPDFQQERHRFYVVDGFESVDFRKQTPGGNMGHRYFDIEELSGQRLTAHASGSVAAKVLNGLSFH